MTVKQAPWQADTIETKRGVLLTALKVLFGKTTGKVSPQMDYSFTEKAAHESGFTNFYAAEIAPFFRGMEAKREAALDKKRKQVVLIACVTLGLAALAGANVHPAFALFPLFFGGCLALVVYLERGRAVGQELSSFLRPLLCRFLGQMTFHAEVPSHFLHADRLRQLSILPKSDRTRLPLAIDGDWRGVAYKLTKAYLSESYRDHNDKLRERSLFRGIVLEIDCPVDMPLVVFCRDFGETLNGLYRWAGRKHLPQQKLALHDAELEALFEVYTDDPARAAETLDVRFARLLTELAQEHQGGKRYVGAAFEGRKFYLALSLPHGFLNLDVARRPLSESNARLRAALADLVLPRRVIDALLD